LALNPRILALQTAVWAPLALLTFGGAFAVVAVQFAPGKSPRLVAVYPPWWTSERALAAASDVAPVSGVGGSGVAIGVMASRPEVVRDLRRSGAWLIADGSAFPSCFSSLRTLR
jgi:hypothetical protein